MRTSGTTLWTGEGDQEAGAIAVFPRGWTGTWQIHETIPKVYVIF
jgi:uncharacterized cupin superfamily protein